MTTVRVVPALLILSAALFAQTPDTGAAHKASATALLNTNNIGAAHLACPDLTAPRVPLRRAAARPPHLHAKPGMPKEGRFSTTLYAHRQDEQRLGGEDFRRDHSD
jgi:hypothetical protein